MWNVLELMIICNCSPLKRRRRREKRVDLR
jgi:hypothetical protein